MSWTFLNSLKRSVMGELNTRQDTLKTSILVKAENQAMDIQTLQLLKEIQHVTKLYSRAL
jgi:hypothetical protein